MTLQRFLMCLVTVVAVVAVLLQQSGRVSARTPLDDEVRSVLMVNGVFLFGDSITVQDGPALERRLVSRGGSPIAMDNRARRATRETVDVLDDWAHRYGLPQRIVLAVGSNDVFDPSSFAAEVDRAMRIAGPDRTVYWVNVYVRRTRQPTAIRDADQRNSAWINQDLAIAADRYPNLRIIPWNEFLNARPARVSTYLRDGVHTTVPLGQNARNQLIVTALTR